MSKFKKLIMERQILLNNIKNLFPREKSLQSEIFIQEHILTHHVDIKRSHKELSKMVNTSKAFQMFIDEEAITVLNNEDEICPLMKKPIKIKHISQCGHSFEKDAIIDYMKKSVYCPVEGCDKKLKANK